VSKNSSVGESVEWIIHLIISTLVLKLIYAGNDQAKMIFLCFYS